MVKYFLGLLLLSGFAANAQKDSIITYYSNRWKKIDNPDEAFYYKKALLKDDLWYVNGYDISNNMLQISGTFLYSPDSIKNGHFTYYFENGKKSEEGDFVNDKKQGVWKAWHKSNGTSSYVRTYNEGYQIGKPQSWNDNGTIYADEQYLTDLNEIKSFDKKDSLVKMIQGNGVLTGICKYYFSNGQMSSKEEWRNDTLVSLELWNEEGKILPVLKTKDGMLTSMQVPEYPGGTQELTKFLSTHVKYPKKAKKLNQQGRVITQFVVDKNGSIIDGKIVGSSHYELLDNEALRVINMMPVWRPGKQHNQPVNVLYILPVTFRLDN